ncbi:hypothetical protein Hanom_Chr16g01436811 [Helianthus anomalus]
MPLNRFFRIPGAYKTLFKSKVFPEVNTRLTVPIPLIGSVATFPIFMIDPSSIG